MGRLLVTGGLGFIGSNFVHRMVECGREVLIVDFRFLNKWNDILWEELQQSCKDKVGLIPILAGEVSPTILQDYQITEVVHFAAFSHVDDSIQSPADFIKFNIVDHFNLLQACRIYEKLDRFIYAGTDEVLGELKEGDPPVTEEVVVRPRNPYSASKASAEALCFAFYNTYQLPIVIFRSCNVYGPRQHPSKFIPKAICNTLKGEPAILYGEGKQMREWIYVGDMVRAVEELVYHGRIGEIYNISSREEYHNYQVLEMLKKFLPNLQIKKVEDRPGHDFRYALDSTKLRKELGWSSKIKLEEGIEKTIKWYKEKVK